ncbi:hydroxypyruvate isomerase [Paraburkholderia steynii]|uniref:Hydroxypyruvate isomerase n=1 Tax=Paraburkholderia steynii TaxID=1245441 RepID=A0A7Z7BC60_9BURK|nr:hypothetical protein [Paraburkholderia steynii]SDI50198.1 hydroxypyruvate isomerase [Paraburkholderia steynii]
MLVAVALRTPCLLEEQNLQLVQMGAPMGSSASGEKGIASFSWRRTEYRDSLDIAPDAALLPGCPRIHVMSGHVTAGVDANWDVYEL